MSRFTNYEIGDRVKFLALIFSQSVVEFKDLEANIISILTPKKCCSGGAHYELEFDDGSKIFTIKKNLKLIKKEDKDE
jgi:hypothetical protein